MSKSSKSPLCALLVAAVLSTLSYAATPDRITGALSSGQTVTLSGNVNHKALPQYDQGPADPGLRFGSIMLLTMPTPSQQKALTRLLAEQQDPKSPNYHKWLTPEQWAERFGLSANDVRKITAWLIAQGFNDIRVARGRNWFVFGGTAAQVESAFGTEIDRFEVNGEMHVANTTSPRIPAALAGIVTGIRGLDDFYLKPRAMRRVRPYYYDSSIPADFLAPGDIATIYDINALYNASTPIDGTGQKLAVIEQTDVYLADLQDFRTNFGLSSISCSTNGSGVITECSDPHLQYVVTTGLTDPGTPLSAGDLEEADLDLEWSGAVARGAQIIYVNAPATFNTSGELVSGGVWVAWYDAVDNDRAPVISMSYGICEFGDNNIPNTGQGSDEYELQKANSEGITFVNSAGDSGAAECDPDPPDQSSSADPYGASATGGLAVSYPASSPEVTGTGGTAVPLADFTSTYWGTTNDTYGGSALSYVPEQGWNDDAEIAQLCGETTDPETLEFCKQGGSTAVSGWVSITDQQQAQEDLALPPYYSGISAGGGGASNCEVQNAGFTACVSGFPQPSWQTVTISGQASARFSPDVSFLASPNFPGYIFCTNVSALGESGTGSTCATSIADAVNDGSIIGGTSATAPIFAGIVTLLNQYLASTTGLGNVNPMLYILAKDSPSPFNHVTTGNNQVYCTAGTPGSPQPTSLDCPSPPATAVLGFQVSNADATTGYNLVTGLGSVDANNLATAWALKLISTTTALTASSTSIYQTQSVTLTATVTPGSGTTTPTGSVTFNYTCSGCSGSSGSGSLGSAALNSSGVATLPTTALPLGADSITASYKNGSMANSTSTATTVTVTAAFTLTPPTSTPQVTPGQSVNVLVALALTSGFSGTVTFACPSPGSEITCTPPPATNASGNVTFTVATTAPTASLRRPFDRGTRIFYAALLPGLVGIVFAFGSRRRSLAGMRMLGLIMVLGFSTLWLGSCGGSSSGPTNQGTPPGTYTINATGTSGSITVPVSFQIVVQ
jgi:subtilase family serine protease